MGELVNSGNVQQLNAQQQAQFLRQTGNSAGRRALARRAGKIDDEMDYDGLCQEALANVDEIGVTAMDTDDITSFYSMSNFNDAIDAAKELVSVVDDLKAVDVLQVLGGIGVPFSAPFGDF